MKVAAPGSVRLIGEDKMLCQICNKNPATIHIQEIVNGKMQTLNLCLSCAGKKSLAHAMFDGMDLSDILQSLEQNLADFGIIGPDKKMTALKRDEQEKTTCPVCSWDSDQFHKTGRLGCPACYEAFADELKSLMPKLHRSSVHTGKLPAVCPESCATEKTSIDSIAKHLLDEKHTRNELEVLEQDLKESVRREEYELAAELRDKIEAIRKTLHEFQNQKEDAKS